MLEYVNRFVINHEMGYGDILTNVMMVAAIVVLFRDVKKSWKALAGIVLETVVCYGALLLIDSFLYMILADLWAERIGSGIFIAAYAALRSHYEKQVRLVRGFVFTASFMLMLPVSEPVGRLISSANQDYFVWSQFATPMIVGLMLIAVVWFLKHFSLDTGTFIGSRFVWVQCLIASVTILVEVAAICTGAFTDSKLFNVTVCIALWVINLMTYYLFYHVVRMVEENLQLNALNQKAQFEKEKYIATRINYDELRAIRHEIKNHNFYLKTLLDEGKYQQAADYLDRVTQKGTKYLKNFDSGNYAVDVVMNHELALAQEKGIRVQTHILVPPSLPFKDEEICSLLSNVLDNAIEAAQQSGQENPEISVSIMLRQGYLLIRCSNPVNPSVPEKRLLSLETTKTKDAQLHGYGTRIIRQIADRYNGSASYSAQDGTFTASVMLEAEQKPA